MKPILRTLIVLLALVLEARAQTVPPLVNYQGRLSNPDGTPMATADYQLSFSVYDSATNSGGLVWGPQVFDGQAGQGHGPKIPVVQGYFNVMLGGTDTNGASLANAFGASNRYVQITVSSQGPILPRQQILSAPFAFQAANAATASTVGGQSAANVAGATAAANAATSANTANALVKRDASGNFWAGTITANLVGSVTGNASTATSATSASTATTANNFSGTLSGDVTGGQTTTAVSTVGGQSAAVVASGSAAAYSAINGGGLSIGSLTVNGSVTVDNSGSSASGLEIGNSLASGTTPFIDFHFGTGAQQTYNVRIGNEGPGLLNIYATGVGTPLAKFNTSGLTINGTFVSSSDRNAKTNFLAVSRQAVLARVLALPITTWEFTNSPAVRHLGPMAQDFRAAFSVGEDDRHIATVDEGGVALAAIQGLNQDLEEKLKERDSEIEQLKGRLERLESAMGAKPEGR